MRKIAICISMYLLLCFCFPYAGNCNDDFNYNKIDSSSKYFKEIGDFVFVKGRWKFIEGNENLTKPPKVNTVDITCNKQDMICVEAIAELHNLYVRDKALLVVDTMRYKIVSWNNGVILATNEYPAADWEIKISVKDEMAERSFRETKSRKIQTADPSNFSYWKLE